MDKKTYYVSVAGGEVGDQADEFDFEFEIEATEKEIEQLQELFGSNSDNKEHGESIYRMLHKLGTPDTKRHIESMNVPMM